jgi:LysM repeat protein
MKKYEKTAAVFSLGLMVILTCGCAAKKMDVTDVPQAPVTDQAVPTVAAAPAEKYVVQNGDTLWAISDHEGIYADSTQWPLIFKTNRDEIQDPDQITPGQVLVIQKGQSTDQIDHAKLLANDTPAFVKHVEPRNPLPIDYF